MLTTQRRVSEKESHTDSRAQPSRAVLRCSFVLCCIARCWAYLSRTCPTVEMWRKGTGGFGYFRMSALGHAGGSSCLLPWSARGARFSRRARTGTGRQSQCLRGGLIGCRAISDGRPGVNSERQCLHWRESSAFSLVNPQSAAGRSVGGPRMETMFHVEPCRRSHIREPAVALLPLDLVTPPFWATGRVSCGDELSGALSFLELRHLRRGSARHEWGARRMLGPIASTGNAALFGVRG